MSPIVQPECACARRGPILASFAALTLAGAAQATNVGGFILVDTTWTAANSPYIVTSQITVGSDAKLTIQPGVVVKFNAGTGLQVGSGTFGPGTLKAVGTPSQKILFTSNSANPQPGQWTSIRFEDQAVNAVLDADGNYVSGSILDDCIVEFGGGSNNASVQVFSSSPYLAETEIRKSAYIGLQASSADSHLRVTGCSVHDNLSVGISYGSGAAFTLTGSNIYNNNGDGLYAAPCGLLSPLTIEDNGISQNSGRGVRIAYPTFFCQTAISLAGNAIAANDQGGVRISLPGFASTLLVVGNSVVNNESTDVGAGIAIDTASGSSVEIRENLIEGNATTSVGGGLYLGDGNSSSYWLVDLNQVVNNSARNGGGVHISSTTAGAEFEFNGNTISGNSVEPQSVGVACGAGVYVECADQSPNTTSVTLVSNTISGNTASGGGVGGVGFGGGFYVTESASANKTSVVLSGDPDSGTYNVFSGNSADLGTAVFNAMLFAADGSNDIKAEHVCWGGLDPSHDVNPNLVYDFFDTKQKAFVDFSPFINEAGCGSPCGFGEVLDCNGNCAPASWIGDGVCDDGSWNYEGNSIYFDCEAFDFDGGDCDPPSDPFVTPPNDDVPEASAYDATTIQTIERDSSENLILVTHGWNTDIESFNENWLPLESKIEAAITASGNWTVIAYPWTEECERWQYSILKSVAENAADAVLSASKAATNGWNQGLQLGKTIGGNDYSHIHLVGHSAGSALISAAAMSIRDAVAARGGTQPVIHCTFLDAFVPFSFLFGGKSATELYGESADFSEQYFYKSFVTDITGAATAKTLPQCWNVDVTDALDYAGCSLPTIVYCGHSRPIEFYEKTVTDEITCTHAETSTLLGFDMSKAKLGASWQSVVAALDPGSTAGPSETSCSSGGGVAGGESSAEDSYVPWTRLDPPLDLSIAGVAKSSESAATVTAESVTLTTEPSANSAWVNLQFATTMPVNFVRLSVDFLRSAEAVGLCTTYFDGKKIGFADEEPYILDGDEVTYYLNEVAGPGTHVISFRLDDQAIGSSTVLITGLATGYGAFVPLGDLDGNGSVGSVDLAILLGDWGGSGSSDFNGDGVVGAADLAVLLGQWTS